MEASEWFEGKNAVPNRIDMSTKFVGKVKPKKVATGGGLKKGGGLKGLKSKKEKDVSKVAANEPTPKEEIAKVEPVREPPKEEVKVKIPEPVVKKEVSMHAYLLPCVYVWGGWVQ